MREYATDFAERQRIAKYYRERYWRDPEFRLKKLNRSRIGQGLRPHERVEDIQTKGPLWELGE